MSNDHNPAHPKLVADSGPAARRTSPETTVARFEVRYRQFLDPDGRLVAAAPPVANDRATLTRLYRAMVVTRICDAKATALQRTGQLGTYPSCQGQEAVAPGEHVDGDAGPGGGVGIGPTKRSATGPRAQ